MSREEEVQQLQKELKLLQQQLDAHQETIRALRERLQVLGGPVPVVHPHPPRRSRPVFSLENFIGLRLIHFVGIVVLVIGLSIGVKYAIDKNLISEGLRIALAYAAGVLLFILATRLRKNYVSFSAILFSGAMATIYFTTYAAFAYYALMPFAIAFIVMILLTVYTVAEAIRYGHQEIALLGLIGAYAIPFLISKNAERAELFFLYISLINLGTVYLAVRKQWRRTLQVAQLVTWLLFIGWAVLRIEAASRAMGLAFMCFFFLLFLGAVASFKIFHKQALALNDTYLLVLNSLALYISALFVFDVAATTDADLSMITLWMAMIAGIEAVLIRIYWKEESTTIAMIAGFSLSLFVLFIAFRWDGFSVTLLWLLTAVVVFGYGVYARSVRVRLAAMLLIGLTLGKLIAFDSTNFTAIQKVIAYLVLGVLLLIVSFFYQKFREQLFGEKE